MVKLGKLTDYGLLLLTCIARSPAAPLRTARDLAAETGLRLPTVSRLLQELLKHGLLHSQRGTKGGYTLAHKPSDISIVDVVAALEGPIALTECSTEVTGMCDLEPSCPIKSNQRVINQAVRGVLETITIADLVQPMRLTSIKDARGNLVPMIGAASGRIQ